MALNPAAVVRLVDANGNTVPTTGTSVTALLASGAGAGTLRNESNTGTKTFEIGARNSSTAWKGGVRCWRGWPRAGCSRGRR